MFLSKKIVLEWLKSALARSNSPKVALTAEQENKLIETIKLRALDGQPKRKIAIREEAAKIRNGRSELEQNQLLDRIFFF